MKSPTENMTNTNEVQVWAGRPSQWVNFGRNVSGLIIFALVVLAVRLVVPADNVGMATFATAGAAVLVVLDSGLAYLNIRCRSYTLTSQRYKYSFGIFSRKHHEIELYRVKDVVLDQPFWLRIVGRANITVVGFDVVRPIAHLRAIPDGATVRESFRTLIEQRRDIKSVRVSERG